MYFSGELTRRFMSYFQHNIQKLFTGRGRRKCHLSVNSRSCVPEFPSFYRKGFVVEGHHHDCRHLYFCNVDNVLNYRARNFRGRVSYFNQSEGRKHPFLASDWLKYETLPRKFRTLLQHYKLTKFIVCQCISRDEGKYE